MTGFSSARRICCLREETQKRQNLQRLLGIVGDDLVRAGIAKLLNRSTGFLGLNTVVMRSVPP